MRKRQRRRRPPARRPGAFEETPRINLGAKRKARPPARRPGALLCLGDGVYLYQGIFGQAGDLYTGTGGWVLAKDGSIDIIHSGEVV